MLKPSFICFCLSWLSVFISVNIAHAHPHIFVDAGMNIVVNDARQVKKLEQRWVFDEEFSAGVLQDFDKDGDLQLNEAELAAVSATIRDSLAEFDFFQSIVHDGRPVAFHAPDKIKTAFENNKLSLTFTVTLQEKLILEKGQSYAFSLYDPTFYVAVDFREISDFTVSGLPAGCETRYTRPDMDKILSQDLAQTSEEVFNDHARSLDFAWQIATRLDIVCR